MVIVASSSGFTLYNACFSVLLFGFLFVLLNVLRQPFYTLLDKLGR